jgi:hypothetical protein
MPVCKALFAAGLAVIASLPARAASIHLQASDDIVITDVVFTVELLIDASDAPGAHPGLYGGQIVVDYHPAQLGYVDFTLASGVSFFSAPALGVATGGVRQTVTLGFDNAPDTGLVGTFTFRALAAPEQVATIGISDADSFFGTFVAYVPTYQPFYPDFTGTSVTTALPLPGAAWLFPAGVALALGRARRRPG